MTSNAQCGWTALHMSSAKGHIGVACLLIGANAHVNQQTEVFSHAQSST